MCMFAGERRELRTFLISDAHVGWRKGEVLHWILLWLQGPGLGAGIHGTHIRQIGMTSATRLICCSQCSKVIALARSSRTVCFG